ncbi:MAG TPA: hypothetical protein VME44_24955 [Streptosporangiaceae bacterium]|nr:hypothetical protein [Streptosporangiaceae bacterium]
MKLIVSLVAVGAAAAATLSLAGSAGASMSPNWGHSSAENFEVVTVSTGAPHPEKSVPIIAYGEFAAVGSFQLGRQTTSKIILPGGTFTVSYPGATITHSINPRTCAVMENERGPIVISHGTGSYSGISGRGTFQSRSLGIASKTKGQCNPTHPVALQQIMTAQTWVKF